MEDIVTDNSVGTENVPDNKNTQKTLIVEKEDSSGIPSKKPRVDYDSMSVRSYLKSTVGPILRQGVFALGRERPDEPIQYLADFLIKNKEKYSHPELPGTSGN